ncbi:hypothetical protein [Edaphovirga cremea]|uniref:hypothetical protein n=1 Tax=Edaphovirga cremea TaxID=2267246 RepID=UPI00398A2DD5
MGQANPQTTQTAQSNETQSGNTTAALQTNFGSVVEASTAFKPFYVMGDFNGDGAEDMAIVVRIKERRSTLPKDVRILNPFELDKKITSPGNPATENKLALVIIHSWRAPQPAGKYMLIGESPILILEYDRAISNQPADRNELIGLMSRSGKRRKGETFPRRAKGDVITLPTEIGGDSFLYWNGRTYVWEDVAED